MYFDFLYFTQLVKNVILLWKKGKHKMQPILLNLLSGQIWQKCQNVLLFNSWMLLYEWYVCEWYWETTPYTSNIVYFYANRYLSVLFSDWRKTIHIHTYIRIPYNTIYCINVLVLQCMLHSWSTKANTVLGQYHLWVTEFRKIMQNKFIYLLSLFFFFGQF